MKNESQKNNRPTGESKVLRAVKEAAENVQKEKSGSQATGGQWTEDRVAEALRRDLAAALTTIDTVLNDPKIFQLVTEEFHQRIKAHEAAQAQLAMQKNIEFEPQTEAGL